MKVWIVESWSYRDYISLRIFSSPESAEIWAASQDTGPFNELSHEVSEMDVED